MAEYRSPLLTQVEDSVILLKCENAFDYSIFDLPKGPKKKTAP